MKLKELLNYYSNYYLMLVESDIGIFNHNQLYLTIQFYDSGVGMRNYNEVPGFIDIMGAEENDKKASEFLKKGFITPYTYPQRKELTT